MASDDNDVAPLEALVTLNDLESHAERMLDKQDFDYYAGGAVGLRNRL